jgi:hypothetical protein
MTHEASAQFPQVSMENKHCQPPAAQQVPRNLLDGQATCSKIMALKAKTEVLQIIAKYKVAKTQL